MTFNLKQYREIYESIKTYIIAAQDRVSDFSDGSVIASEIEAFAREMSLLYSEARAGFSEVLSKLAFSIFSITKHPAQKAIGVVTFGRVSTVGDVTIPLGAQIATAGGVIFETTAAASMANGVGSVNVAIQAVETGKSGNVPAGTITIFVSGISGVDSVINAGNVGGGVDEESDAEYLSRFRAFLLGLARSNRWGVIYGALLNPALRSVSLVEHFPPKDSLYNATLYLDDGSGTVSAATIAEVKASIDGDGTVDFPGYRAAGINLDYLAPSVVTVDVIGVVYVSYAVELAEAKAIIDTTVAGYLNSLLIGQDVIRAQLQKAILDFPWVLDLDISSPAGNIAISTGQIARAGTVTIAYEQTTGE